MKKNNRFYMIAKKALYTSEVMAGRTKASTEDLIERYPEGFTITEFDMINNGEKTYPAIAIAEDPEIYFFGGVVLNNLCKMWIESCDGDIDAAVKELNESGGLKIKMKKIRTKNTKREFVAVELAE